MLSSLNSIALRWSWRPDLIYTHSLGSPRFEEATLKIAPAVFFAHAYYGTCVSGAKTFKRPTPTPCGRRFGPACLLQYYPRRCGGWSPLTMARLLDRPRTTSARSMPSLRLGRSSPARPIRSARRRR